MSDPRDEEGMEGIEDMLANQGLPPVEPPAEPEPEPEPEPAEPEPAEPEPEPAEPIEPEPEPVDPVEPVEPPEPVEPVEGDVEKVEQQIEADREDKRLREENEALRRQLTDMAASFPGASPAGAAPEQRPTEAVRPAEPVKPPAPPAPPAPPRTIDFVQAGAPYNAVFEKPEALNEALTRVYVQARRDTLRDIPVIVDKLVTQQVGLASKADAFYRDNRDLEDCKGFVAYVGAELESAHPDWDMVKLFSETEKEARKRLARPRPSGGPAPVNTPAAVAPATPRVPAQAPGTSTRKPAAPEPSALEKELDDIIPEWERKH